MGEQGGAALAPTRSRAACAAAFATPEKLDRGVLLLDYEGVVQFINRAVRVMISRGHGLSLRIWQLSGAPTVAGISRFMPVKIERAARRQA